MKPRRSHLLLALACVAIAISAWALPQHPLYREWRLSHLTLEQLRREAGEDSDDFRLLYYTGLRLNARRRYAEALPLLLQSMRLRPDEARIRDALAQAQMAQGQTNETFNQLAQFVGTHPDSAESHLLLGKFYLVMKSGLRAQQELERAVALAPDLADGWAALAEARSKYSADTAATLAAARQAARLRPANSDDHFLLATLLLESAPPEARTEFERALALAPNRADIRESFANSLLGTGRAEDRTRAEQEARLALQRDPESALASRVLGQALVQRGAQSEAVPFLIRASSLDPYDVAAPAALVRLFSRMGRSAESRHWQRLQHQRQSYLSERDRLLNAALAVPGDSVRSLRLAQLLARHGERDEALRYQGLAQGKPGDAFSVLLAVAKDLTQGGYADRALPLARRAVALVPDHPQAQETLGDALLGQGNLTEAALAYQKAEQRDPKLTPMLQSRLQHHSASPSK